MEKTETRTLRGNLLELLSGGSAHLDFDSAVADHNAHHIGHLNILRRIPGLRMD